MQNGSESKICRGEKLRALGNMEHVSKFREILDEKITWGRNRADKYRGSKISVDVLKF